MKKLTLIVAALLMPTIAAAQSDPEVSLKVNNADVAIIGEALGLMPYTKVAPLINKLQVQIQQQQKPVEPKKESDDKR